MLPLRRHIRPVPWILAAGLTLTLGCATPQAPQGTPGKLRKAPDGGQVPTQETAASGGRAGVDGPPASEGIRLMAALRKDLEAGRTPDPESVPRLNRLLPGNPEAWFLTGRVYRLTGSIVEARSRFLRALELDPAHVPSLTALGDLALEDGDLSEADLLYARAYDASPTPSTANRLAMLRISGGYLESARAVLAGTLERNPGDAVTRNNLAVALDMMGFTARAMSVLSGGDMDDPRLLRTRAVLQLKEGRPEAAAADLESGYREDRIGGEWLILGTVDLQQGRLSAAEDKFRSAIVEEPGGYEGYLNLGLTLRRQGRFTEAQRTYLEGIRKAPHTDLHLNLGVLYELYRGEPVLALEQYREYLRLKGPASDRVREWAQYLEGVVGNPGNGEGGTPDSE